MSEQEGSVVRVSVDGAPALAFDAMTSVASVGPSHVERVTFTRDRDQYWSDAGPAFGGTFAGGQKDGRFFTSGTVPCNALPHDSGTLVYSATSQRDGAPQADAVVTMGVHVDNTDGQCVVDKGLSKAELVKAATNTGWDLGGGL